MPGIHLFVDIAHDHHRAGAARPTPIVFVESMHRCSPPAPSALRPHRAAEHRRRRPPRSCGLVSTPACAFTKVIPAMSKAEAAISAEQRPPVASVTIASLPRPYGISSGQRAGGRLARNVRSVDGRTRVGYAGAVKCDAARPQKPRRSTGAQRAARSRPAWQTADADTVAAATARHRRNPRNLRIDRPIDLQGRCGEFCRPFFPCVSAKKNL